jgi:hypothetical protein
LRIRVTGILEPECYPESEKLRSATVPNTGTV